MLYTYVSLYVRLKKAKVSEMLDPTHPTTDPFHNNTVSRLLFLCSARNVQQTKGAAGIQKVSISQSISSQWWLMYNLGVVARTSENTWPHPAVM